MLKEMELQIVWDISQDETSFRSQSTYKLTNLVWPNTYQLKEEEVEDKDLLLYLVELPRVQLESSTGITFAVCKMPDY